MYLLLMSVWDIKERRVPMGLLVIGSIVVGVYLGYELFAGQISWLVPLLGSLPGVFLLIVARISKKAGYADGIVLLWLAATGGYQAGLFILGISLFLISVASIVLLVLRRVKKETRIPYIPFLTVGYMILQFAG